MATAPAAVAANAVPAGDVMAGQVIWRHGLVMADAHVPSIWQ